MVEEAHPLPQQYMGKAHMEFVKQPRLQSLLNRAGPMKSHIFLACEFLRFRNRAFNTIGDKVKLRVALFFGCSCLRLQDYHRPGERRAVRHDPSLLAVNLLEASASHDYRAALVHPLLAHDFMEPFHCLSHPGEDL